MLKHILLIKTTSMGDVIHTLPAIQDAVQHDPKLRFHWVVEAPFAEIAQWHPSVVRTLPVRLRRWRGQWWQAQTWREIRTFRQALKAQAYDAIIDAQGLIKSAVLARMATGPRYGFAKSCARESLAARFYQHGYHTDPQQHAIQRTRELFAQVFGYDLPALNYGLERSQFTLKTDTNISDRYIVLLHGTTWTTKHWPESYWQELAKRIVSEGFQVQLLWGNEAEKQRADNIAQLAPEHIVVQPRLSLTDAAGVIAHANGVVAVDTGLGHLAAALGTPTLSLYGPTNPALTGTIGNNQVHLAAQIPACAPCLQRECSYQGESAEQPACFAGLTPEVVWQQMRSIL